MPLNTIVQHLDQLPNFAAAKSLVFDTETSGVEVHHGDRMCGFVIGAMDQDVNYYVPIRHNRPGAYRNLPVENVLNWLRLWMTDGSKTWVGHNLKFDLHVLRAEGVEMAGRVWDTMIAAHLVHGDWFDYGLDTCVRAFYMPSNAPRLEQYARFNEYLKATQQTPMTDEGRVPHNYSLALIEALGPYACEDAQNTRDLAKLLAHDAHFRRAALPNQGFPAHSPVDLCRSEMDLVKVLFEMESLGVKLDLGRCREMRDRTRDEVEFHEDRLKKLCGHSLNVNSSREVERGLVDAGGKILFWNRKKEDRGKQKDMQFTTDKANSTGNPCFNAVALLKYLQYFKAEKNERAYEFMLAFHEADTRRYLLSNNLDVFLQTADARGYAHPQFHQHRTVTGRLASTDFNAQNIARVKGTVDQKALEKFLGHKNEDALNRRMRELFICEPDEAFVSIDYSQIEYRAAAYFAIDDILIERYRNDPNTDYHQVTADLAGIDRDTSKNVNFGVLYGMGANGLAAFLLISVPEAKAIIAKIMNSRPALRRLLDTTATFARKDGEVQNPYGRVCRVVEGKPHTAINYLIQGFVGDMMRRALVRMWNFIQRERLPIALRLTVHDEADSTMPREAVIEYAPKLAQVMCDCPEMGTVPTMSEIEVGRNWGRDLLPFREWIEKQPRSRAA